MVEQNLETLLEATLFGAGRSLSSAELADSLQRKEGEIISGLMTLQTTLKQRRDGALQLADVSGRWSLEVKPKVAHAMPAIGRTEIPPRLLPIAALIAYHQPMTQSQLVDMVGPKTYDHVRDLAQLGLVDRRRNGVSRRLTTTRRFSEYFGCPHSDVKRVRQWFRERADQMGLAEATDPLPEQTAEDETVVEVDASTDSEAELSGAEA